MASSPRIVVSTVTQRVISPKPSKNFLNVRTTLSPQTPKRLKNPHQLCLDTPNRIKMIEHGPPKVEDRDILGCGAFGTVYKASYKGSQVAAKLVKSRRNLETSIKNEKNAALLNHENIVCILGIEEGKAWSLITMELCGTSLQDKLNDTGLDRAERINTWRAMCCALEFCHNAGIVHADVKPKNVLIGADGQPKLADFGSSVVIGERSTNLRGTPGYAAPEVIKGHPPRPQSDVYSLGILAWQMLSRVPPFSGLHPHTILYLTGSGSRPEDSHLEDECNGKYKSLYKKLWAQYPAQRLSLKSTTEYLINM